MDLETAKALASQLNRFLQGRPYHATETIVSAGGPHLDYIVGVYEANSFDSEARTGPDVPTQPQTPNPTAKEQQPRPAAENGGLARIEARVKARAHKTISRLIQNDNAREILQGYINGTLCGRSFKSEGEQLQVLINDLGSTRTMKLIQRLEAVA